MPEERSRRDVLLRAARRESRWWLYRKGSWDGPPLMVSGADEYGRCTIVLRLPGHRAVVYAHWTCTCEDCHEVREQTYRWACDMADIGGYEEYAQRVNRALPPTPDTPEKAT